MLKEHFSHGDVLALWQGERYLSEAARDIEVPKGRFRTWIKQGNVPPQYWPRLIGAVKTRFGVDLTTDQLTAAAVRAALAKESQAMEAA